MPFYCPICGQEMQVKITQNFQTEQEAKDLVAKGQSAKLNISLYCDHKQTVVPEESKGAEK